MAGLSDRRRSNGRLVRLGFIVACALTARTVTAQDLVAPSPAEQQPAPAPPGLQPAPVAEGLVGPDSIYADPLARATPRYQEPPLPPFDYWQPTWMPCQSLRTNRSLVLGHLYYGMDILGWSTKGVHAPALVTTSPLGTAAGTAGVLGQPQTSTLFGGDTLHKDMRPGGRLTIGWWFDPNQYSGIEFQYFELDGRNIRFDAAGNGGSILARPFVDATTGNASAALVAYPGLLDGSIGVASDLQLTSTGILFRKLFWASEYARLDYLVGYRHAHLYDRLRVDEAIVSLDNASGFAAGSHITRLDQFRAINQFDGADLGLRGWWSRSGTLAVTSLAKVALGATNRNVIIQGSNSIRSGGVTTTSTGGVLAQASNIGRRSEQDFGVVGELGMGLEWMPACFWKFSLGYSWFYWSDVARAVNQIDTAVDPNQLAPTSGAGASPAFHMQTTSFWAQGLTAGFSYQY